MNIFSRLDNLTDLTTNEQTLVDYMKNNPERFINMSADEISAACFISIPTIYRLCKKQIGRASCRERVSSPV